ncbi:hypothetical protein HPB50_010060 [Hyalomma asiaticum]|uniref:Uncharacterized protein n=1 Tax=Hyalomma asiaticum TaxID=266040 RepID=A0ACB7SPT5_HYAAI|nr:hypothetical protein HPB50_010060 [Hyalomma asiaticum]
MGRVAVPHRKQVVFRAAVGSASTPAFIALDDIAIVHQDRCETVPKGSDVLSATELLSCDLNDGNFCKWSSLSSLAPKGTYVLDRLPSLGPRSYPTKGGIVSFTGSDVASVEEKVVLNSATVGPQSQPFCFSFWYHMFGGRGAFLKLYLDKPTDIMIELFYHRDRTTADRWYNVRRTLPPGTLTPKLPLYDLLAAIISTARLSPKESEEVTLQAKPAQSRLLNDLESFTTDILGACMMGTTESVLITFSGTIIPRFVYFKRVSFRCRPHKPKPPTLPTALPWGTVLINALSTALQPSAAAVRSR